MLDDVLVKLAVVGSRGFDDYDLLCKVLDKLTFDVIVSGGAKGADKLSERYAKERNIPIEVYHAIWRPKGVYDASAGFKRNVTIWDKSSEGVAFWDGKSEGTKHSFELARKQGKRLLVVNYVNKTVKKI